MQPESTTFQNIQNALVLSWYTGSQGISHCIPFADGGGEGGQGTLMYLTGIAFKKFSLG